MNEREAALGLLERLGRVPYDFQADVAVECLEALDARRKLLVQAPTGSGKTLIAQLLIALRASALTDRWTRGLVVVPSRALLGQHVADAAWIADLGFAPLHLLDPELPVWQWRALISGGGVYFTTPVALRNRLWFMSRELQAFDFALFDEVDLSLTREDLAERRDLFPAIEACIAAGLPVIGFTGTGLDAEQRNAWARYNFRIIEPAVPDDWLPFTRIRFVPIADHGVQEADAGISDRMSALLRSLAGRLGQAAPTWSQLKRLASLGDSDARALLQLVYERLELFEQLPPGGGKTKVLAEAPVEGPVLTMCRFHETAERAALIAESVGHQAKFAHGGMRRDDIDSVVRWFRGTEDPCILAITRELGGRGLDFPGAVTANLISPRADYQAVAQELARIRSRRADPKTATILYFAATAEQLKAARLATHLKRLRYRGLELFEVDGLPAILATDGFVSRNLRNEESLTDWEILDDPFARV